MLFTQELVFLPFSCKLGEWAAGVTNSPEHWGKSHVGGDCGRVPLPRSPRGTQHYPHFQ